MASVRLFAASRIRPNGVNQYMKKPRFAICLPELTHSGCGLRFFRLHCFLNAAQRCRMQDGTQEKRSRQRLHMVSALWHAVQQMRMVGAKVCENFSLDGTRAAAHGPPINPAQQRQPLGAAARGQNGHTHRGVMHLPLKHQRQATFRVTHVEDHSGNLCVEMFRRRHPDA